MRRQKTFKDSKAEALSALNPKNTTRNHEFGPMVYMIDKPVAGPIVSGSEKRILFG
jgi:hypothetical protein